MNLALGELLCYAAIAVILDRKYRRNARKCREWTIQWLYVEIKCQLDATEVFLLQILLLAQHVLGITMPIIRSSRVLYSGCCVWYFCAVVFQVPGLVWS